MTMVEVMDLKTDPELLAALRKVAKMTPQDVEEQLVSFVWGCLDNDNPMSKDDVRRALGLSEPQTGDVHGD